MLFNLSYKNSQNLTVSLLVSASSISNVIVYCDANQINPLNIGVSSGFDLILNEPSSQTSYSVSLKGQSENNSNYVVYDTWSNLISWINSQTGKTLQNIVVLNRGFVTA